MVELFHRLGGSGCDLEGIRNLWDEKLTGEAEFVISWNAESSGGEGCV